MPTGDPAPSVDAPWPGIVLTLGALIVLVASAAVAARARRSREALPRLVLPPSGEPATPAAPRPSGGAAGAGGSPGRRTGDLLQESGTLSGRELATALEEQHGSGDRLGTLLVASGAVPATTLTAALARQLGFETLQRSDEPLLPLWSAHEAQTWPAVPLDGNGRRDGAIPMAPADPTGLVAMPEARFARPVVPRLRDEARLDELNRVYATNDATTAAVLGYATVAPSPSGPMEAELDEQAQAIAEECKRRGLVLLQLVRERETGCARAAERPGLSYAINRISAGEASGLVVSDLRRLSPTVSQLGDVLDCLLGAKIRVVVAAQGLDTAEQESRVTARMLIEVSGWERKRLTG